MELEFPNELEWFDGRFSTFEADCIYIFIDDMYNDFGCFVVKLDESALVSPF